MLFWARVSSWIAQLRYAALVPRLVELFRSVLFWARVFVLDCPVALRDSRSPLGGIILFGVNSWPVFRCFVLDCPAALRASRSPFGEMISFGVILGPCVVSDCPAALRAGRNLVLAQSSFVVGPSRPRHVS